MFKVNYIMTEHKFTLSLSHFSIHLILMFCIFSFLNGDRIKSKIYKQIESKHFCFRRMNGTNQIGCNSKESGNVGIVHLVNDEKDMTHVLSSGFHSPYIPVITPNHFNVESMIRFKKSSDRISGVLVVDFENQTSGLKFLSPDKSCPNEHFDLYVNDSTYGHCRKQQWNSEDNSYKEGLMFYDWPFPIFFIKNQTNIDEIKDCYNRFKGPNWPLCAVQLEAPMNAAKDSVTCLRRTAYSRNSYSLSQTLFCDPLGGTNIFNTLLETSKNESINNKSVVVLSARLDSFSMFDNLSPGADSALTSVVTLLSVANTLSKIKSEIIAKANKMNVLFALFDGEAFDYIGSSRVVFDMNMGKFPSDPDSPLDRPQIRSHHFSYFIELSQLAQHNSDVKLNLWIHKNDNNSKPIQKLEQILKESSQSSPYLQINSISEKQALPPASLQTFLKSEPSIAGIVLTNHRNEYSNKFYNSLNDYFLGINESESKLSQRLTDISTVISKTIYKLLTNQSNDLIKSDETLVEQLLDCYLRSPVCHLFKYVLPDTSFYSEKVEPLPTYVGVFQSTSLSSTSRFYSYLLLSYLTGDVMNGTSKDQCIQLNKQNQRYSYLWMGGKDSNTNGVCVRSQTIKANAISPAFDNYGIDGKISDSNLYSTWTESQWKSVTARMFVMPSAVQQWLTLITGLIVLVLSFSIVYILDLKSSVLFDQNTDIVPQQALGVSC